MAVTLPAPMLVKRSEAVKQHLRCTPDGTHLVYAQTRGPIIQLRAIKTDGSDEQPLFKDRTDFIQQHPSWSPDGKRLAFTVSDGHRTGRIGVMLCDAAGMSFSNFRPLLMGGQDSFLSWSPDGKHAAFISSNMRLTVASADGGNRRILGPSEGIQGQPCFAPDGRCIAFSSSHPGNTEIFTIRPDGAGLTRLTRLPAMSYRPVYSPDGQWISFTSNRDGDWNIFIMRPDGTEMRNLTQSRGKDDHSAWSPDSRELCFISTREGSYDIYRQNVT